MLKAGGEAKMRLSLAACVVASGRLAAAASVIHYHQALHVAPSRGAGDAYC